MRMRDDDLVGRYVCRGGYGGDEACGLVVVEQYEVELHADHALAGIAAERLGDDDIGLQRSMHPGGLVVAGGAPHSVVDANRRGDIATGIAKMKPGGGCFQMGYRHGVKPLN